MSETTNVLPGTPATAGARVTGAALVGGAIGVIMQVIMTVLGMVLPADSAALVAPLSLIILGIVGAILAATGAYMPISAKGGFGAAIMFCGLADATCGIFAQAKNATGKTGAGVAAAIKFALAILGTIALVGGVFGCALGMLHVPGGMMTLEAPTYLAAPMSFVGAFVGAAVISAVGQLLLEATPLPLPAVILLEGAIGMALVALGLSVPLDALCAGGVTATVVGAAMTVVASGVLIAVAGVPVQYVVTVSVMAAVVVFGIIAGLVAAPRMKGEA